MISLNKLILFAILLLLRIDSTANAIVLADWKFRNAAETRWYPAQVPGGIYKDLQWNNLIPDPCSGINETKLAWIDSAEWEYRCVFDLDSGFFSQQTISLELSCIDTYAAIYINDSLLKKTDNQFRSWTFDVKNLLRHKNNSIVIHFYSDLKIAIEKKVTNLYVLPGEERVYIRKAAYKFGWDFGPRFIAGGIKGTIQLTGYTHCKINSTQIIAELKNDLSGIVTVKTKVSSQKTQEVLLTAICKETGETVFEKFRLSKGGNDLPLKLKLTRPEIWYPNGLGKHPVYTIAIKLTDHDGKTEIVSKSVGFRKIELIREKDSIGTSFYFKVNGLPVFMKGANIVPPDHFVDRSADSLWTRLVKTAVELNMNMLRVWGGGVYPPESFFDACDENGILVWQDFMFACAMYPGDSAFLDNVKNEAEQQVERISGHASLAIWCGNNENDEGWHNWGWQKQYSLSSNDSAKIWNDYENVFKTILAKTIRDYNPEIPYVSTSPQTGWGRKESLTQGDCHYWGVWWGKEPFETYAEKVPRFMSEYGFQSLPSLSTLQKICGEGVSSISDTCIKQHQKHPVGFETIEEYRNKYFKEPKNFSDYITQSQQTQWIGLNTAISAHRTSNGRCMGTLLWQLNDTWPGISWSIVDHEGKWKYAAEKIKEAYLPIAIFAEVKTDQLEVKIISDSLADIHAYLVMERFDRATGKLIEKTEQEIQITYRKLIVLNQSVLKIDERSQIKLSLFSQNKIISSKTVGY
jgi:beta-mannosidase